MKIHAGTEHGLRLDTPGAVRRGVSEGTSEPRGSGQGSKRLAAFRAAAEANVALEDEPLQQ